MERGFHKPGDVETRLGHHVGQLGSLAALNIQAEECLSMSHHYSGPDFGFPRGDARLDFTDLYAFPKPGDPSKSILMMNVHPSAVVNSPGPSTAEPFAPEALYELKIDTNGDAVADIAYRVRFSSSERGAEPPRCAGRRVRTPPVWATAGKSSPREHGFRRVGKHV